jgi:hypothetical protein
MRKRRLFLAAGASLATLALTMGTALADPPTDPPPTGTITGSGAQTTQGILNDLCNNVFPGNTGTFPVQCASYDIPASGLSANITPRPATQTECNTPPGTVPPSTAGFPRPNSGGPGFDALVAHPTCLDFARVVADSDKGTRPRGFTYIPFATDALTYAYKAGGTVPPDLDVPTLKAIYGCTNPALTGGTNPRFKPLIGTVNAGNRVLFLQKIGLTEATLGSCVQQGFLANDGRVLTDPHQLITYSSAPYFAQVNQFEPDIHGEAVLGGINGIPPEILNDQSFISRPVFNVVKNSGATSPVDTVPAGPVHDLFVGPTSQVCSNPVTIQQHGFNLRPAAGPLPCGDTSDVTTN